MSTRSKSELWEEKYLSLRDEHEELKKQSNDQRRMLKQMYTKLQMIDGAMAKRGEASETPARGRVKGKGPPDKETDSLIASLRKENQHLKKVNLELREKLRNAGGAGRRPLSTSTRRPGSAGNRRPSLTSTLDDIDSKSQQEVVATLRKRLMGTEERMKALHEQNNALRRRLESHENVPNVGNRSPRPTHHQNRQQQQDHGNVKHDLISLQRDVKDKDAQILIVKNRYDNLEAKARAAAEIHERTVFMMEEGNRTIRDLRRKIQSLQHENQTLLVHQERAEELDLELKTAREECRKLEERMTALCESPFINDAFESRSRVDKLVGLERADRQQKVQIEHLKETAKMHHAEILALKSSAEQLSSQRDALGKENHELKLKLDQIQRGAGVLEDKMKLYSGEAGVDSSDLEKALTMVKRNQENLSQVNFIESGVGGGAGNEASKQKLQSLQVVHLNTCRELEMTERMLKAQTSINKDLNAEINDLQQKLKGSNNELHRKLDDYENLCAKRLQRIHALEAQVKQLMKKKRNITSPRHDHENDEDDNVSVVSLAASASDFGPGENLIEVWVVDAKLNEHKVDPGVTTFIMLDFYDYETQTSPLLTGLQPAYNFAATYRISTDHFFLRYLSSETLTLELCRTKHADYELLAQCTLSLRSLLTSNGKMKIDEAELISVRDGSVIGTMSICIRLALPIKELFDLYLREVPGEKERMERLRLADAQEHDAVLARARAQNQLEISVVSCTDLPTSVRGNPSPFVHFQFLSFPDTFTSIVQNSASPVFNQRVPFPVLVDKKLVRFIERETLEFNVLDDDEDETEDDIYGGIVGKAAINLSPLAYGEAIKGEFPLLNVDGEKTGGKIELNIRWRSRFVVKEDAVRHIQQDKMELNQEELVVLLKQYEEEEGSVNWRRFLQLYLPTSGNIQKVQTRVREAFAKVERKGVHLPSLLSSHVDETHSNIAPRKLESLLLEELSLSISRDDLQSMFSFLASSASMNTISVKSFIAFSFPPSEAINAVEKKIKDVFHDLASQGEVKAVFKRREDDGNGLVSIRQFCLALKEIGFVLSEHRQVVKDPRDEYDFSSDEGSSKPVPSTKQQQPEQEAIIQSPQQTEAEDLFARKKLEFQERISRASAHSEVYNSREENAERDLILRTYGTRAEPSALRLQSHFRGYTARKGSSKTISNKSTSAEALIDAEDSFRSALARREEIESLDLRPIFARRDRNRTGFISKGQFVRCLADCRIGIMSEEAAALAHHFTTSDNEDNVDYNEFIRFARYQFCDVTGLSLHVRNATLQIDSEEMFRKFDKDKGGTLSRREFGKVLRKVPSLQSLGTFELNSLLDIFDIESTGEIDYVSFVKFCRLQPLAIALRRVENKLKDLVKKRAVQEGSNLMASFQHFDLDGDGSISRSEFKQGLRSLKFDLSQKELHALYARLDPGRRGRVSYKEFARFITSQKAVDADTSAPVDLDSTRKLLMNIVRGASVVGLSIHGPFEHYDWKRTGLVTTSAFQRSCNLIGFPLTVQEQNQLAQTFGTDKLVKYREFLEWITPSSKASAKDVVEKLKLLCFGDETRRGNIQQMQDIFKAFDVKSTGEITRREFFSGLEQQLGVQLSKEEIVTLMNNFDRDGDGYIQYKEFVGTLTGKSTSSTTASNGKKKVAGSPVQHQEGEVESPRADDSSMAQQQSPQQQKPMDKRLATLMEKILYQGRRRGIHWRRCFEVHDEQLSGTVSRQDFVNVVASSKPDVDVETMAEIADYLDDKSMGRVPYGKFLNCCSNGGKEFRSSDEIALEEKLRIMIKEQMNLQKGEIRVPFSHFDRKRKGKFDLNGWLVANADLALNDFSKSTQTSLFHAIDLDGDGYVALNEFNTFVNDPEFDVQLYRKLRKLVLGLVVVGEWDYEPKFLRKLFKENCADSDRDKMDRHGLKRVFKHLGLNLPREDIVRILARYDSAGHGRAPYKEICAVLETCSMYARQAVTITEKLKKVVQSLQRSQPSFSFRRSFTTQESAMRGGIMDKGVFMRKFAEVEIRMEEKDLLRLCDCFTFGGNSIVDVEEFMGFFLGVSGLEGAGGAGSPLSSPKKVAIRNVDDISSSDNENFESGSVDGLLKDLQKLIKKAKQRGVDYHKSFSHFDRDNDGFVTLEEFDKGLKELGFNISKKLVQKLYKRFSDHSGRLKYRHFLRSILPSEEAYVEELAEKLRKMFKSRAENYHGGGKSGLAKTFRHFEVTRGEISRRNFRKGLEALDFNLNDDEVRQLLDMFDQDGDGRIDFEEFRGFVDGTSSATTAKPSPKQKSRLDAEVDEIFNELRSLVRKAHRNGVDYRLSFEHFDPHYTNRVGPKDFQRGLQKLGFDIRPDHVRMLLARFSTNDGMIKYRDFLKAVAPSEEASAQEIVEKFQRMLQKTGNLRKAFKHFERNEDGNITRKAFKKGMYHLNFDLSDSELRIIMDLLDEDGDGQISFAEFVDFSNGDPGVQTKRKKTTSRALSGSEDDDDDLYDDGEMISFHFNKLKIASPSSSLERVYIQYKLSNQAEFSRTPAYPLSDTKRKQTLKMDTKKMMKISQRTRRELRNHSPCKIDFEILGVKSSGRTKTIATATADLTEINHEDLTFYDQDEEVVAKLKVEVRL